MDALSVTLGVVQDALDLVPDPILHLVFSNFHETWKTIQHLRIQKIQATALACMCAEVLLALHGKVKSVGGQDQLPSGMQENIKRIEAYVSHLLDNLAVLLTIALQSDVFDTRSHGCPGTHEVFETLLKATRNIRDHINVYNPINSFPSDIFCELR
jgi:hypothetical protein